MDDKLLHKQFASLMLVNNFFILSIILIMMICPVGIGISIFFFLLYGSLIFFRYKNMDSDFILLIFFALLLKILLVLIDEYVIGFLPPQPDATYYHEKALIILDNFRKHNLFYSIPESTSVRSYSLVLSLFYSIFGPFQIVARLVNSVLSISSALIIYKITLLLYANRKIAFGMLVITLFFPTSLAFNSYGLRDSLIIFFTYLMIYHFFKITRKNKKINSIFLFCFSLGVILIFRVQHFILLPIIFFAYIIINMLRNPVKRYKGVMVLLILSLMVFLLYILFPDKFLLHLYYPLRAQPLRAAGGSAYLGNYVYDNFVDILIFLPIRFIFFSFGPFLGTTENAFQLLSAFEGLFIFIAFVMTVCYFITKPGSTYQKEEIFLLIFTLIGLAANAMVDSNFGTAVRHRLSYVIFLFLFAIVYWYKSRAYLKTSDSVMK